jgi:hypothetical protein
MHTKSLEDRIECAYDSNNLTECLALCDRLLDSQKANIPANLTKVMIFMRTDSEHYNIEEAKKVISFLLNIYPDSQKL